MKMSKPILLLFVFSFIFASFTLTEDQKPDLPKVFLIGEYEDKYESLTQEFSASLMEISGSDINSAFKNWINLATEMESYSKEIEFNLDGIKVWINVYWSQNGGIEHIAYYLKPDSRRVDTEEMNAFFTTFISNYKGELKSQSNFTHSGSVSFPTIMAMRGLGQK